MKKERGITLLALAVTIVIMLILATITITAVKKSGIIDKSKKSSISV